MGFRPILGSRFRPLPISFWGRSKNKSGSKLGVIPRVGVLSRDFEFFRRKVIALDTHALPSRVAARVHYRKRGIVPRCDPQVLTSA
ncbi:unnamed protein product [Prunus armeniaca]